jgi:HSP20 family protein
MDTVRRDGELVLRFDVPGFDPEKIDVTVDRGVLTVSATREETKTEGESPVVRERLFGSFTRRVRLSDNLDADSIEASNNDGVLEIRIPVREEAKPRKIEVGTSKELAS